MRSRNCKTAELRAGLYVIHIRHTREPTMVVTSPARRSGRAVVVACLLLLALAAAGAAAWWALRPSAKSNIAANRLKPDPIAAIQANNRGLGRMERFEYREAVADFEQVVGYAPDWLPGRINLGIALLNATNVEQHLERATEMFEAMLKEEPNNPYAHH